MIVWGIDPGSATGAIVCLEYDGSGKPMVKWWMDLPIKKTGNMNMIALNVLKRNLDERVLFFGAPDEVFMERLAPRGMMAKMMIGYGALQFLGPIYNATMTLIPPQTWKKGMDLPAKSSKTDSIEACLANLDGCGAMLDCAKKYLDHRAEAALVAAYGARKRK